MTKERVSTLVAMRLAADGNVRPCEEPVRVLRRGGRRRLRAYPLASAVVNGRC